MHILINTARDREEMKNVITNIFQWIAAEENQTHRVLFLQSDENGIIGHRRVQILWISGGEKEKYGLFNLIQDADVLSGIRANKKANIISRKDV